MAVFGMGLLDRTKKPPHQESINIITLDMGQKHLLLTPVGEVLFIMKPSEINRDARKNYEKGEKIFCFPALFYP